MAGPRTADCWLGVRTAAGLGWSGHQGCHTTGCSNGRPLEYLSNLDQSWIAYEKGSRADSLPLSDFEENPMTANCLETQKNYPLQLFKLFKINIRLNTYNYVIEM